MTHAITPCLWFSDNIQDAVDFYTRVFPGSTWERRKHYPDGRLMWAEFVLHEQVQFSVLNGGDMYQLTPAISLFVDCESQAEVDRLWAELTADGGREMQCGWLTDQFGVTWQIVPRGFMQLMNSPDSVKAKQMMNAMMGMKKLDLVQLQQIADSHSDEPHG